MLTSPIVITLTGLVGATFAKTYETQAPLGACEVLYPVAPDYVLLPDSSGYEHDQAGYWSLQQTELRPRCRFIPDTPTHLLDGIDAASYLNTSIAFVSGGHSSNVGASNIEDGMTINLSFLTGIYLSEDKQSIWLGPAARWSDVYAVLEPYGLTVAGARAGHVGVGGYVLGGGLSWFANLEGWACDSATGFGVITPNLHTLWVNSTSHEDLFWALKGSLGAFGVVFSIQMRTIPNPSFYGGAISYEEEAMPAVFAALTRMAADAETYPASSGYLSLGYNGTSKEWTYNTYAVDTSNSSTSPSIGNLLMIPNKGHNLRHMSPKESADEIAESNPLGFHRSKFTLTILPTMEALNEIHEFLKDIALEGHVDADEFLGVTFQPLTVPHLRNQDNMFDSLLTADYGPLMLVSFEVWWKDEARTETWEREMRGLCEDGIGFALKWMLVLHPWIYPNYAARWQEPFDLRYWGEDERAKLKKVKERYDPDDVWSSLVPGIWHI